MWLEYKLGILVFIWYYGWRTLTSSLSGMVGDHLWQRLILNLIRFYFYNLRASENYSLFNKKCTLSSKKPNIFQLMRTLSSPPFYWGSCYSIVIRLPITPLVWLTSSFTSLGCTSWTIFTKSIWYTTLNCELVVFVLLNL